MLFRSPLWEMPAVQRKAKLPTRRPFPKSCSSECIPPSGIMDIIISKIYGSVPVIFICYHKPPALHSIFLFPRYSNLVLDTSSCNIIEFQQPLPENCPMNWKFSYYPVFLLCKILSSYDSHSFHKIPLPPAANQNITL